MMTYEEMRKEFVKKVAEIQEWTKNDWDFLNEECGPELENGEPLAEKFGIGTVFEEIIYDKKHCPHIIEIIEYVEQTYDSDGNISNYNTIGYDIEF